MNTSNINDKLKDDKGNLYFFKNSKKVKYVIPENVQENIITKKDNIFIPLIVDTEYTAYNGNLQNMTLDILEQNQHKQLLQLNNINDRLVKSDLNCDLFELGSLKEPRNFDLEQVSKLNNIKQIPTLHLTTQVKHVLYEDAEILLNPRIKSFYEQQVTDKNYLYPYYNQQKPTHMVDFLKLKGIDVEFSRRPDLDKPEFKKFCITEKYPMLTIKMYAYFILADLLKIFHGYYLHDLLVALQNNEIKQDRRFIANNKQSKWYPNWLVSINGITYRVALDFVDLSAIQGKVSYNTLLINLNMDTSDKNLLDDLKDNMLLAMVSKPEEFKRYALGDLNIYEALKKHNDLIKQVYIDLGIGNLFKETSLTTGSTVNNLQVSVLLNYLGLEENNTENLKKLKSLTSTASPANLRCLINTHEKSSDDALLRRPISSKTHGGRCYNNRMLLQATSSNYSLCDIDISSAYTSIASALDYYFGSPVILNFKKYKVTLDEFFKYYESKHLIKRGFKIICETKKDLTIEQDLIPSWVLSKRPNHNVITEGDKQYVLTSIDLNNTPTAIYTKALVNSTITWDELDLIINEMSPKQRDELLKNVYMITAMFYPKDFECKTIGELERKNAEHLNNSKGRFEDIMEHSYIDNEDFNNSHYWHRRNFGDLFMSDIIQMRLQHKKSNMSLSYLFKLVGNTAYGVNVSRHFDTSNIILAANITSMCRCGMWYTEKACNIAQTITDGGVFDLNEVNHLMGNKLNSSLFTRAYQQNNGYFSKYNKWATKPITKNKKKIEYHAGKGWLIDDEYYGCDRELLVKTSEEYKEMQLVYDENHPTLKLKKDEFSKLEMSIELMYKKINELTFQHVQRVFSKNDLFNGQFKKCMTDEKGLALKDNSGNYLFESMTGLFKFEVKHLCNSIVFHGSADYMYNTIKNEKVIKMRGYEARQDVVSWYVDVSGKIKYDQDYYSQISPIERFMTDLRDNPTRVRLPRPFTKTTILKTAEYRKNYNKTWQHSNIIPGCDYYELVRLPVFTMRFKFTNPKQHKKWISYFNRLKRRFGGLSLEVFYMNDDGTINYKLMIEEIDLLIAQGLEDPKHYYDKYNHLARDLKGTAKAKHIDNYMNLINTVKNVMRITQVGIGQFIRENAKVHEDTMKLKAKISKYLVKTWHESFENIDTYSGDNAFKDYENFNLA